ncbi:MAG: DUF4105 domain-containing protein [Dysgonamonadaceae bacterium]|jgi:hypothetical protein|nr:DUF4105 domain-containing protein [Dysgonamonadaceae bacterium]
MRNLLIIILLSITVSDAFPNSTEKINISLLTVAPRDKAIYTVYGHTAMRIQSGKLDIVINWGTFDSNRKNFVYHFVRGETDYFMSVESYNLFEKIYIADGAQIIEQEINIPDNMKVSMLEEIYENLRPHNAQYRYNYFFDNCTLRPRNLIEKYSGGTVVYPQPNEVTLRDLVHDCTNQYPWMKFGIDIVIGNGADSLVSRRTELFLPQKLSETLDKSVIRMKDGRELPVVLSKKYITGNDAVINKSNAAIISLNPLNIGILMFIIFLVITILKVFKDINVQIPFAILFFITGCAGCIVIFLMMFSSHPCVSPNWNIVWLNPLHFIGCAGFACNKKKHLLFDLFFILNIIALSVFIIAWHWIPQTIDIASLPIIGCLLLGAIVKMTTGRILKA